MTWNNERFLLKGNEIEVKEPRAVSVEWRVERKVENFGEYSGKEGGKNFRYFTVNKRISI